MPPDTRLQPTRSAEIKIEDLSPYDAETLRRWRDLVDRLTK